jgi:hypothetical protein
VISTPRRVDRQILRHILNALGITENEPGELVPVAVLEGVFYEHVDFVFGQTEDLAELADHGAPLKVLNVASSTACSLP